MGKQFPNSKNVWLLKKTEGILFLLILHETVIKIVIKLKNHITKQLVHLIMENVAKTLSLKAKRELIDIKAGADAT